MTRKTLKKRHGTPKEFERAVLNALGEISWGEAMAAINKYRREWKEAK